MKRIFLSLTLFLPLLLTAQPEPLRVFDAYRGSGSTWIQYQHLDQAWYGHVHRLADQYLARRSDDLAACTTREKWESRQRALRENLLESIGGLPEKTPLRAQTLGTLERPDFTVEKIIYESLPGFYVTAGLFLPKQLSGPAPAVIYCSGHTANGFRSETYQRVIINLVKKGFIVLAFDPIGQGERYQYLDARGRPDIGGPTKEHSYAGLQCLLKGESVARYMINDGIRTVDYLLTRPEVDPDRIGITGRSGGGTQSSYIAAFDDRIQAVAPENYITSFRRIWAAIGPQDAEQNFLSAHVLGIDHGDLLSVRAPKPALMLTTTRDYFSIQGARETFREVQRIYELYEAGDQFHFAEDDHPHGSTAANREAMNAFFQRALNLPGDPSDQEVALFTEEELTVTPTGQVVTALNSRTIFDLIQMGKDASPVSQANRTDLSNQIRAITGIEAPAAPTAVFTGRVPREDYIIEKYFLEFPDGRYPLPFLWIKQRSAANRPLALYLDSEGKENGLSPDGEVEQLLRAGYTVVAPDLLNAGELKAASFRGDSDLGGASFNLVLGSSLVGKSLTTLQTEDIFALMDFVRRQPDIQLSGAMAIADEQLCLPLLHYAVLEPSLEELVLREPLASWQSLLKTERYDPKYAYAAIPGALPHYDVPDLLSLWAPRKLHLVSPRNARGNRLGEPERRILYAAVRKAYQQAAKGNAFKLTDAFVLPE